MGLFNEVKSLITIKADASQAKAEVKSLSGVEKQAAKERLAGIEAQNKKLEGSIATFAKAAGALTAIGVAGKIAFDAIEFSGRRADLTAAAGTVSIDRLRKATLGLRTDTQLLELAGKLNHAQIRLTAAQMDLAGRAATALAERGGDAEEAFEAVTTALVTGKTKGLTPFGIQVDETADKAEKFASIMKQLSVVSGEVSESTLDASDKIGQQRVKFANIFDTVQDGIGKVATEMLPLLDMLTSLGSAVGGSMSAIGKIAKYGIPVYGQVLLVKDSLSGNVMDMARDYAGQREVNEANAKLGGTAGQLGDSVDLKFKPGGAWGGARGVIDYASSGVLQKVGHTKKDKGGDLYAAAREQADEDTSMIQTKLDQDIEWFQEHGILSSMTGRGASASTGTDSFYIPQGEAGIDWEGTKEQIELAGVLAREALDSVKGPTLGEKLFGSVTEMDMYKETWAGLTGAVGAGYDAMVDGSMGFGKAAKMAAADAIKATGKKMLIRGLEETAEGFGALARYDYPGAGNHFLSALKFGAGAAIAGYTANAIGTSGGASAKGATPGATAPDSRGGSSKGGSSTTQGERIIVYEDAFAENNAHERSLRAERVVRRVIGSPAVRAR